MIPVFTYYQLLQSLPGGGGESDAVFANLNNTATMTAYYNDLTLFFQKAGAFPGQRVVLHVEPDFWGYMQQRSSGDAAASVPAKVSETGIAALQGLPSNVAGFAQAIVRLRNTYAVNVTLAYHLSVWGTNVDIAISNPPDATVDALGVRAANFYRSLGANFDLSFAEFSDRDAAFKQYIYGDGGISWWDAEDFRRSVLFLTRFSTVSRKRLVMWQIPFGNTRMRSQNNTWAHYQDNRVEWLFDEPARTRLLAYRGAGVIAFLFGGGASGRDVRVQRGQRRRHRLPRRSTATRWHRSSPLREPPRPRSCAVQCRRSSRPTRQTTTAGSFDGGRGPTTRRERCRCRRRRGPRRTCASSGSSAVRSQSVCRVRVNGPPGASALNVPAPRLPGVSRDRPYPSS